MASFAWLRARPKAILSAGVVTVAALTVGFFAVAYEGKPTTEVDLHDGGVWVTKQSSLLVGHFNHQSRVLDGGLRTGTADYDLLQSGSRVLVVDSTASSLSAIDPARVIMSDSAELKPGSSVAMGSDTVAVLEPTGALWTSPFTAISGIGAEGAEPVADEGKDAKVAVGVDGTVYAASSAEAQVRAYGQGDDGATTQKSSRSLDGVAADHTLSLTVVGTTPYVLDHDTDTLYGGDGSRVQVPHDAVLQQPSGTADAVTLATPSALVRVPVDGGAVQTVDAGSGESAPSEPVYVAGCAYGAWSGTARFVRDCPGEADDSVRDVPGVEPTSKLRFRVNRDVVVLNDVFGGAAWMASDSMQRVDNWQDITPPEGEGDDEDKTTEETVQTTLPERTDQNTPPIAQDDQYGVRPGRTTVLPVLDNDTDPDGDVLVASPSSKPGFGTVEPINNGAALQVTTPEGASGTTSFRYTVDDGRGGEATATVTLTVHPFDVNSAPVQKRTTPITVESGGTASYNVLSDWIDPDGDDIFLKDVAPDGGDEADFTPDGQITYRAIGGVQGRKDAPIIVSDGTTDGAGVARYDIRPLGTTVPVTNADHVVTRTGLTVTVSPLTNDTSSGSEPLRLTRVDDVPGATIVPDFANKTFTFTAAAPGTYYPQYLVSAGPNSVPGIVRVDVLPASDHDLPPVAVRDIALLPVGGDVLVNVLSNDSDPNGGILVVQSVTSDPGSGVAAAVLGHETVRVSDVGSLSRQVRIGYTISNGSHSATGEIVVIPVPPPAKLRPPVANDDQAVVRVGDTVTIPVLANDYHPNGDAMHVAPDLVPPLVDPADGEAFVSEDKVRFRAGDTPRTAHVTYEAVDSTGQRDAGYVTIQILPRDDDANSAPKPHDLTARTLSGARVTIPVPLDGIDQDGDSVALVGVSGAPQKGRIVETGADSFTYEAFQDSAGVDAFSYRVRDSLGKDATAAIQVGIAPAASVNQAPYAVRDSVVIRPGREVAVPVLANDSDPDGDEFGFAEDDPVTVPDVPGLKARVSGKYLLITAPDEPMNTSLQYAITDSRGARASTSVQITVDPEVPLERPIARDDRVLAEELKDGTTANVAVLENDDDPDGTKGDLTVTLGTGGENARVNADGTVHVQVADERQLITYTVTDPDGLTDSAFIRVPALTQLPPSLISTQPVEVKSGESIDLPLSQYVRAAGGKDVSITEAAKVSAVHANGAGLIKDQHTLVYTSADRYFGSDALTFEVTDGTGPDDPAGRKATLTIPITVLPPDNQPPTMLGASMSVAPGEDATVLDLAALATDPDPDDQGKLTFRIKGSTPQGISSSVDGTQLKVSAAASTAKGTRADLTVTADDGTTTPAEAIISITVTASTRPLATANDDVVARSDQGSTESVAVLDNDVNPFPGTPLKVENATLETGKARVAVNGDHVEVTSDPAFVGVVVARYRVTDATGDPDRAAEGRIRITVQGKPDAPGRPVVSSIQSRTVVLSWTPPTDNGSAITGYTVASTASGYTKQCASTTCTLDGLTNNVEYNFVVTATNTVGTSDPSMPSETARPDVRPDTPAPPTLQFGDRSLTVSWAPPGSEGSPVTSYTLEISPAPPSGIVQKTGVTGTSIVWDGLENGSSYQVRVRAHNKAPDPSEFSPWSASMVPAAPPSAAAAPTTTLLDPVGSQAQIRVDWGAPDSNGDAISAYELRVLQGGSVVKTVPVSGGQTRQAVVVDTSTTDYTFDVRAQNKAGWGERSPQSAPRRGVTAPSAPTNVAASEGDNTVGVTWAAGAGNGAASGEIVYQFSVNGGDWSGNWASGGGNGAGTIGNGQVNNNGTYTIRVRAVSRVDGSTYASGASNDSNAVAPYGAIGDPSVSATASGTTITYSWSSPARNGRDVATEVYIDSVLVSSDPSGSTAIGYGYSETHGIEVRTTAAAQTTTAAASARTVDAPPPPQPRVWVSRGDYVNEGCDNGCYRYVVNTQNFPAGNYAIDCWHDTGGPTRFGTRANFELPANGSVQLYCWKGADGNNAWVDIVGWGGSVDTEMTWWPRG